MLLCRASTWQACGRSNKEENILSFWNTKTFMLLHWSLALKKSSSFLSHCVSKMRICSKAKCWIKSSMMGLFCCSQRLTNTLTETQTGAPHHSEESGIDIHAVTTEKKERKAVWNTWWLVQVWRKSPPMEGLWQEFLMTTCVLGNSKFNVLNYEKKKKKSKQDCCSVGVGGTKLTTGKPGKNDPSNSKQPVSCCCKRLQ